ncbi:MAG: tetratricopeptide repeat protein [Bacteroidales bacterium]|nr:tetratricopeptide repeat protein [Bacteroidales bacterium]
MKRIPILLIITLFMSLPLRAQDQDGNFITAVSLYSSGDYTRAQRILETLSKADPSNDAVWYYKGMSEFSLGEQDKAETSMRKAVQLDSTNFWYRRTLARLLFSQGRTDEGTAMYEEIVRDFPDRTQMSFELLEIYLRQRDFEKALASLDEVERLRGTSEEIVRTRFDIYNEMGRHQDAIDAVEKFNADYSSPMLLSLAGDYYLSDYADSLAAARYSEALDIDGSYAPATLGMSEVYRRRRNYPEYFRTLQGFFASPDIPGASKGMYLRNVIGGIDPKILQIHRDGFDSLAMTAVNTHPTDSTVLTVVGTYLFSTGRQDAAGVWFIEAADQYPESKSLTTTAIQYLGVKQNWEVLRDRALDAFNRFHDMAFLEYANMANYNLKDYDAIIGNCRYIVTNYPKDKDLCLPAWSSMGDAYHEKGQEKEAFKAYKKALKINPDYAPVLNNYAYYLALQNKQLKKAYNMSKKTVEAEPNNATYLDTFGWILHLMGRDLEAKPFFKHAMLYGGKDSAVMLEHYAEVLEALGEHDLARTYRIQAKAKK